MIDSYDEREELEIAFSVLKEEQGRFQALARLYGADPNKIMDFDACQRKVRGIKTAIDIVKYAMFQHYQGNEDL